MSNEPPPTEDGEELVEADLPGMDGGTSRPDQSPRSPDSRHETPEGSPGDDLADSLMEFVEGDRPDPLDKPVEDSVLDELSYDLPRAMTPDMVGDSHRDQPEVAQPDPTNDGEEDLVEADLPTTSSGPETMPSAAAPAADANPMERIDRAVEEWGEHLDDAAAARREERLQSYRDEYGEDVDAEAMLRYDEAQRTTERPSLLDRLLPSTLGARIIALLLVGMGSAIGIIAALSIFGGSGDDEATSLPAAATEPSVAATVAPTLQPTIAATIPRLPEELRLEQLALDAVAAMADADGDLWLTVGMQDGISVDPDTLAFVYAFAMGAAVQTDAGYHGFYYAITDGSTYGEAVFGSPDFPRTSGTFNAGFQITQPELWMTEDGKLAIHLPGDASGGLDASLFGPDTLLIAGVTALEEQGGVGVGGFEEFTLGEISVTPGLPLASWIPIDPDQQPLQLNVPDTSNRN